MVPEGVLELCSDMAAASWELSSGKAELPRARTGGGDAGRGTDTRGARRRPRELGWDKGTRGAGSPALIPAPCQTLLADGVLHGAESSDYRGRRSDGTGKPRLPLLRWW